MFLSYEDYLLTKTSLYSLLFNIYFSLSDRSGTPYLKKLKTDFHIIKWKRHMKNALRDTVADTKSKKRAQIRKRYIFKLKNIHVNRYTEFHISQEVQQKARFFWKVVYSTACLEH